MLDLLRRGALPAGSILRVTGHLAYTKAGAMALSRKALYCYPLRRKSPWQNRCPRAEHALLDVLLLTGPAYIPVPRFGSGAPPGGPQVSFGPQRVTGATHFGSSALARAARCASAAIDLLPAVLSWLGLAALRRS